MLAPLVPRDADAPRESRGFTRRQLLVRGGIASGALIAAGAIIRVASLFDQPPARGRRALSEREALILGALIPAALPGEGTLPAGDPDFITKAIDEYLAQSHRDIRLL